MNKKLNAKWHSENRMPKNPTFEQRMQWHIEHARNCSCRKISDKLKVDIKKYKSTKL